MADDGDTRRVVVDEHHRQPAVARLRRAGAHERDAPLRHAGLRRPDLVTVDHPVVAVAHRLRAQRREVAARVGLGEALAPRFVAAQQRVEMLVREIRRVHREHRDERLERVVRLGHGHADAPTRRTRARGGGRHRRGRRATRATRSGPNPPRTAPPAARADVTTSMNSCECTPRWRSRTGSCSSSHCRKPARKASRSSSGSPVTGAVSPILRQGASTRGERSRRGAAATRRRSCFGCGATTRRRSGSCSRRPTTVPKAGSGSA